MTYFTDCCFVDENILGVQVFDSLILWFKH